MKKLMMVYAVVSLFAVSGAVWAEDGGGRGSPEHRGGGMRSFGHGPGGMSWVVDHAEAAKKLGVTDDQIAQLREMKYNGEIAQIKCRADLEVAQMELRQLLDSAKPTEEAAGKAVDKISGLEAQLQKARIGEMLKARAILGEETMGKLHDAMREQMRERGRDRDRKGDRHGDCRGMGQREDRPVPPQAPAAPVEEDDDEAGE